MNLPCRRTTRGIRTTRGSLLYANHVPETDAGLVYRIKSAGAIIIGKTDTSEFFRSYDLLICPTMAIPAFASDGSPPATINGVSVDPLSGWLVTYPFNLTGNPVAAIPCPVASGNMPIGLPVIGRRRSDSLVLRTCRAFERVSPRPKFTDIA